MLFHFHLRPMPDIAPWHDAGGGNPQLGWFGLTDGWYWINAGGVELFRYSKVLLQRHPPEPLGEVWYAGPAGLPYVDYQVAQFWSDVLGMLPDVREPVPLWLAQVLVSGDMWAVWERQAEAAVMTAFPGGAGRGILYDAMRWLGKRRLDSAYLVAGPDIQIWSDGRDVHIQWDNRELAIEGIPAWEADVGHYTMTEAAYLDEVRAFDARFLRRMRDRVAMALGEWTRPDVALDPYVAEHQLGNEQWSRKCFAAQAPREPTDWETVSQAIARIEALPQFDARAAIRLR